MSLTVISEPGLYSRFPRVSGDEPQTPAVTTTATAFSPRERG